MKRKIGWVIIDVAALSLCLICKKNVIDAYTSESFSTHFFLLGPPVCLAIYRFDSAPQLNSSINLIDGWTSFCPSSLSNEGLYTHFIDNVHSLGHGSVIYGLREMNAKEITYACSNNHLPISDERWNFSANYELRAYTSGCYYLDANNQWQADGLVVGPLTNHQQTQCFSTHLTTFASSFTVLPTPVNWDYAFARVDLPMLPLIFALFISVLLLTYSKWCVYASYKARQIDSSCNTMSITVTGW